MKIRHGSKYKSEHAELALGLLAEARDEASLADCPKTLARIRLAISSAKGAVRHAHHRQRRSEDGKCPDCFGLPIVHTQNFTRQSICKTCNGTGKRKKKS